MTQIRQKIDRIIGRLKQHDAFSGVSFVREYGNDKVETPVRGLLAVVGITKPRAKRAISAAIFPPP